MVSPQMSNPTDPNLNPAINSSNNNNNGIVDEILSEIENTHLQKVQKIVKVLILLSKTHG